MNTETRPIVHILERDCDGLKGYSVQIKTDVGMVTIATAHHAAAMHLAQHIHSAGIAIEFGPVLNIQSVSLTAAELVPDPITDAPADIGDGDWKPPVTLMDAAREYVEFMDTHREVFDEDFFDAMEENFGTKFRKPMRPKKRTKPIVANTHSLARDATRLF